MMETGSGETARTASLLKEKLLQRAPEHGKYPMDIEGLVITRRHEANRIETCFSKPSVSVIIQGSKRTMLGFRGVLLRRKPVPRGRGGHAELLLRHGCQP